MQSPCLERDRSGAACGLGPVFPGRGSGEVSSAAGLSLLWDRQMLQDTGAREGPISQGLILFHTVPGRLVQSGCVLLRIITSWTPLITVGFLYVDG